MTTMDCEKNIERSLIQQCSWLDLQPGEAKVVENAQLGTIIIGCSFAQPSKKLGRHYNVVIVKTNKTCGYANETLFVAKRYSADNGRTYSWCVSLDSCDIDTKGFRDLLFVWY